MRLLVVVSSYPHPGHPFSGIFNEKSVLALAQLCEAVEVLAPRPYVPPLLASLVPKWRTYTHIVAREKRNGIPVHRPVYPHVPRLGGAFWIDPGAFLWCRRVARALHRHRRFTAILSFDLAGAGGLAWRIGQDLGIPAAGWATGSDVRLPASSSYGATVIRALQHLDLVFYQSHELQEKAAALLGLAPAAMPLEKHHVLPRGIALPPFQAKPEIRARRRKALQIADHQILVMTVGRITREKGVFELIEAITLAAERDPRIVCVLVGAKPAFDETAAVQRCLAQIPALKGRIQLLPASPPDKVWEYLCAADLFAFTSHHEGMPNSLLEAMSMGIPAVAFAIPPVREIANGTDGVVTVPPFDVVRLAEAMLRLAVSPAERMRIGKQGQALVKERFLVQQNMAVALKHLAQIGPQDSA